MAAREDRLDEITVDWDWCSTGIWVKEDCRWYMGHYEDYALPRWLVERFEY
jgi:hypothetical protein